MILQANRAYYQAYIWWKCLESHPGIASLVGLSWDRNDNNDLIIKWSTVLPAPEEVLQLMYCSCPRKCLQGSCPCTHNLLLCTEAWANQNCDHFPSEDNDERMNFSLEMRGMRTLIIDFKIIVLNKNYMNIDFSPTLPPWVACINFIFASLATFNKLLIAYQLGLNANYQW